MKRMTPQQLVLAAADAHVLWPGAELRKNGVGNLAVYVDGVYVGFIDLRTGEVVELELADQSRVAERNT